MLRGVVAIVAITTCAGVAIEAGFNGDWLWAVWAGGASVASAALIVADARRPRRPSD